MRLATLLLFLAVPAHAAPLSPVEVCTVRAAIRAVPWSPSTCAEVAAAFADTDEPRTLAAVCVLESDWREGAQARHAGGVVDVGLCGVRCRRGKDGRCQGGPAHGLTVAQLKDAATNIRVAGQILVSKRKACGKRALSCYLGREKVSGQRASEVAVILAAFGGVSPTKGVRERVKALARKIALAVRKEREP